MAQSHVGIDSFGDSGGASRFFARFRWHESDRFVYCAKASRAEREAGLNGRMRRKVNDGRDTPIDNPYQRGETERLNEHTTVKPIALMAYLVRLVTPPGGTVLDPYLGSGTTACAAILEGFEWIGAELDEEHAEIIRARTEWARAMVARGHTIETLVGNWGRSKTDAAPDEQRSIFDVLGEAT